MAARKGELEELLASHKAVQLAKDEAKAELAHVEQQLRSGRAARAAQLQQHLALVSLCIAVPASGECAYSTRWWVRYMPVELVPPLPRARCSSTCFMGVKSLAQMHR